jgi:2-polyprenyl-3-methyl-5-hydroxy-6-metoxy-1,4-benzoquinol methylase
MISDADSSLNLATRRMNAAVASGGTSTDAIYGTIEKLIDRIDPEGDVLDFGAGVGALTRRLAASGRFKRVVAVDLMARPEDLDASVTWTRADLNDKCSLPDKSFDLIVCAEIVEHLENPRAFARECARLLRSGGTLILSTPNNESWRSILSLVLKGCFAAFNDQSYPAHITPLVRLDIRRLLLEAGFEEPTFVFTDSGSVPKRGGITWQQISFGLLRGMRFSDNLVALSRLRGGGSGPESSGP